MATDRNTRRHDKEIDRLDRWYTHLLDLITWLDGRLDTLEAIHSVTPPDPPHGKGPDIPTVG